MKTQLPTLASFTFAVIALVGSTAPAQASGFIETAYCHQKVPTVLADGTRFADSFEISRDTSTYPDQKVTVTNLFVSPRVSVVVDAQVMFDDPTAVAQTIYASGISIKGSDGKGSTGKEYTGFNLFVAGKIKSSDGLTYDWMLSEISLHSNSIAYSFECSSWKVIAQ
ncbi:MAG: hypothetical protein EOP09_09610 [Proteobacteria bacterium]|nr:MAG: hypothetical protein EOP09_09610 [Pseudomonadota bacterium]